MKRNLGDETLFPALPGEQVWVLVTWDKIESGKLLEITAKWVLLKKKEGGNDNLVRKIVFAKVQLATRTHQCSPEHVFETREEAEAMLFKMKAEETFKNSN
jgi:hypothetical protein